MATCIICKEVVDDPIFLRDKGVEGVNFASSQRKREDVVAHIGSAVHKKCRKRYVDKTDFPSRKSTSVDTNGTDNVIRKRSRLVTEERHNICLFCNTTVLMFRRMVARQRVLR